MADLRAWRGDAAARARTRARRAALSEELAAAEPLAGLARALDALVDPPAEAVAALVRPVLADARWLDALIVRLARAVRDDPFLEPPLAPMSGAAHEGLLLYRGPHAAIFAGVGARAALAAKRMRPRAGTIAITGQLSLIRFLAAGGATLSLWRGGLCDGVPVPRCLPAGTLRPRDGALVEIDGRDAGYVVEHARGDLVLLQAAIFAGSAPLACEYDAATLALAGVGAAREEASRAEMLTTLLAALDLPADEGFGAASRRPEPHVRWHAMRGWAATDAAAARPRLAEMAAADPDAELRALAAETLALVEARCPA